MKAQVILTIAMLIGSNSFAAPKHQFIMDHSDALPEYASHPGQVFSFPSYYGKLFLANSAEEIAYATYPGSASYPSYYPEYATYPNSASYPSARKTFEARAALVCQFMNFTRARYASSVSAASTWAKPAELLTVSESDYGDLIATPQFYPPSTGRILPTFIDILECVR